MYRPGDILWKIADGSYRHARRIVIFIVGMSVLIAGLIMFVPLVPGPGFVVIPIGLGILAIEFEWARRARRRVKHLAMTMQRKIANGFARKEPASCPPDKPESPHSTTTT